MSTVTAYFLGALVAAIIGQLAGRACGRSSVDGPLWATMAWLGLAFASVLAVGVLVYLGMAAA